MNEYELYEQIRRDPPPPPWVAFPEMAKADLGWRMGVGETHLYRLEIYFRFCSPEDFAEYRTKFPEPQSWSGWYDGRGLKIEDSEFYDLPEESRIHSLLSPDASRLVVVGRREDGLFRVRQFIRQREFGLIGTHWAESDTPSLTDTEESALQIAQGLLDPNKV